MGACYGLGQALSRPRPGLGACLAAGALAVAILLALHAVALPLLYAFGPGEILPALLATLGLAAVVSWLALSIDEAAFFGLAGTRCPFWGQGRPCSWFRCPSRRGGMPAGGGEGCLERSVLG